MIPHINISPSSVKSEGNEFNLEKEVQKEPDVEPEPVEVEVEKKGAMKVLRK